MTFIPVQHVGAEAEQAPRPGRSLTAAQYGSNPCQQLAMIKGLGQIVVGPHFQAHDAIHGVAPGRKHDDRRAAVFPQTPCQTQAVLSRQHDVQQHEVHGLAGQMLPHGLAITGPDRLVAVLAQIAHHQISQHGVVVHHKNMAVFRHANSLHVSA